MKLIQPSENTIMDWRDVNAVDKIEYALKHGNYKTRQLAAEALEQIGRPSSIPILLNAMNDKIQKVSIAALNALEALGCNDDLVISITRKRFNWVKELRDKEENRKVKKDKKHNIYRWKRASKESFDRVKEQLKKPMR
ncbi:HEAT repeat domain-containing protein [Winogradskyella echinorum]|uniref:HEAT repeat domain-containing protein n=2 Tax=Winogradskyella echinorum TaxID=538189 RepID=A0ABR6Y4Z9_9FLAO|nr:HEAT repeat domain-containing protein [Winogradskyella echinorum]MBC5751686.1 HEAT repeat domain-containing protein [Winogradskyella echinorum]